LSAVLAPLIDELQKSLMSLDTETSTSPVPPASSVDPVLIRTAGEQLAKLLSEFDPGATDFVEGNRGSLRPLFSGEEWPAFENLVQSYGFSDAQAQLERALKQYPAA
jgi:hypothetical protein